MPTRADLSAALRAALPVMLGYVTIGIPCGVMAAEVGLGPPAAFLLSSTFYSGAGQFMMASLALAGTPIASMIASVALVSTRQLLYSAALSPYLASAPRPLATLFAATVTDESFGVNLDRFAADEAWGPERATAVNLMSMLSWAFANALGAAVGPALAIPTTVMSFAMTSIFVCLLVSRSWTFVTAAVVSVSVASVLLLKALGVGSVSVLVGALAGIAAGLACGSFEREGREAGDERH